MSCSRFFRYAPYLACLVACAIVNLIYFPPGTIFPDEQRFLASAAKLAATGEFWVASDRAWEMPGTALLYTPAVWLFGTQGAVVPIRFCQSLLLLAQCALVGSIARRLLRNDTAASIATWVSALYPFFLYYQGLLLSEALFDTLLVASIAALLWWRDRGGALDRALVATCMCFAAATMTKATLTVLPPLLVALTAMLSGFGWRRAAMALLASAVLYAALLSPWWVRNAVLLGEFVPFTTGSSLNLYIGNNPHNREGGIDWSTDVDQAVVARIRAMPGEVARQHAFAKEAIDYIKAHPDVFLLSAVKKFFRFWNVVMNASEFRGGVYSLISAASFGPVLALALIALVRLRRQWRELLPIATLIGYFTALHVVTIASLRYRLPLEPFLIVLASEPLAALLARLRGRASRDAQPLHQSPAN